MPSTRDPKQPQSTPSPAPKISRAHYDAVVLDLDGVITRTAAQHAHAWKSVFDEFMDSHAPQQPFDIEADYRQYVDGKPRYEGVRSFLESRHISLPRGQPNDPPEKETICGLGNLKNNRFRSLLKTDGVEVFPESVAFIKALREAGFGLAVASSSRNCQEVLEAAKIQDLFDARVDGVELERLRLEGKPAPDMFIEACHRVNSAPERSVGIEDADVGVRALKAAQFGLVIGIGDDDHAALLREQGADIVVNDLGHIHVTSDK